jgi:lipoprotein
LDVNIKVDTKGVYMKKTLHKAVMLILAVGFISACSNNANDLSSGRSSSSKLEISSSRMEESSVEVVASTSVEEKNFDTENSYGWGDNMGGRRTYTVAEINNGALGDTIVLNSIEDDDSTLSEKEKEEGVITPNTNERDFIGIRDAATGNRGKDNVWNIGKVDIEEGKTYIVRMYIHNNNPKGMDAIAKDVTAQFYLEDHLPYNEARISGIITSSNAVPSRIWHTLLLRSADNRPFALDYIEGSAILENNVFKDGVQISDDLVGDGVKVGYDKLDGNLPGCYQYSGTLSFEVQPIFE